MSVALKQSLEPTYGRHETFTLRHSWAKKGFDLVADPEYLARPLDDRGRHYAFNSDDVHHTLGVGKNMARSVRFWLQSCRLVEEERVGRKAVGKPTAFGEALLDDQTGLDPYLEDSGTWWLLHWMMLSPGSHIPVWWAAFHTFNAMVFSVDQLLDHVKAQIEATSSWRSPKPPSDQTVKRDVLALLRNYAGTSGSRKRDTVDDVLDAPFVPLTLIRPTETQHEYRFGLGPKPGLPPAVAAFACFDFLSRTEYTSRQALVASLASEQGGPGRAFKLTEDDLADLCQAASRETPDLLSYTEVGGSPAIAAISEEPLGLVAAQVLQRYYARAGAHDSVPEIPYLPWSIEEESDEAQRLIRDESRGWT